MRSIAGLASRDVHQSIRVLGMRYELTAYACYKPAVELFDEHCFDISQVCLLLLLQFCYSQLICKEADVFLMYDLISITCTTENLGMIQSMCSANVHCVRKKNGTNNVLGITLANTNV